LFCSGAAKQGQAAGHGHRCPRRPVTAAAQRKTTQEHVWVSGGYTLKGGRSPDHAPVTPTIKQTMWITNQKARLTVRSNGLQTSSHASSVKLSQKETSEHEEEELGEITKREQDYPLPTAVCIQPSSKLNHSFINI